MRATVFGSFSDQNARRLRTKEPATAVTATRWVLARPMARPAIPHTSAPISGSAMISQSEWEKLAASTGLVVKKCWRLSIVCLVPHRRDVFDVDRAAAAEDRDH